MSEQPQDNHQQASTANSSPQTAQVNADEPTGFDRLLAAVCIIIGVGVIILGLDALTGGRVLGFADQQQE